MNYVELSQTKKTEIKSSPESPQKGIARIKALSHY